MPELVVDVIEREPVAMPVMKNVETVRLELRAWFQDITRFRGTLGDEYVWGILSMPGDEPNWPRIAEMVGIPLG